MAALFISEIFNLLSFAACLLNPELRKEQQIPRRCGGIRNDRVGGWLRE
jgi:hypothetical protein